MEKLAQDRLKRQAAERAADFVENDMVVGLGHGSTAIHAIRKIAARLKDGSLAGVLGVPCSRKVENDSIELGIPLTSLNASPVIDLTIDGADEVDPDLNVIKGGGGALLREKIVAQCSRREIIVVDASKQSARLGTRFPVPVEVFQFAYRATKLALVELGARPELRCSGNGKPFISDEGNYIIDCDFGPIENLSTLSARLDNMAGVVGHGLFVGLATDVIVAAERGIVHIRRGDRNGA